MIKSNPRMTQSDLQAFRVFLQQKKNNTTTCVFRMRVPIRLFFFKNFVLPTPRIKDYTFVKYDKFSKM